MFKSMVLAAVMLCGAASAASAQCVFTVYFAKGGTTLSARALATLDQVARIDDRQLRITGHSDVEEAPAQDQRLSIARAKAVRAALVARGISKRQILETSGSAGTQPLSPVAGHIQNRRVVIRRNDCVPFVGKVPGAQGGLGPSLPILGLGGAALGLLLLGVASGSSTNGT